MPAFKRAKEIWLEKPSPKIVCAHSKPIVVLKLLFSKQYNRIKPTYLVVHLLLFSLIVSKALVEKGIKPELKRT